LKVEGGAPSFSFVSPTVAFFKRMIVLVRAHNSGVRVTDVVCAHLRAEKLLIS
jgi:hypothetical protein